MDNLYGGFINGYLILSGTNGETQQFNISMTAAPLSIPITDANGLLDPSWQASLSVAIDQYLASLSQQLYELATNTSFSVQQMYQNLEIISSTSVLNNIWNTLYSITNSTIPALSTSIASVSSSLYNSLTHLASGTINPSITYAVFYVG